MRESDVLSRSTSPIPWFPCQQRRASSREPSTGLPWRTAARCLTRRRLPKASDTVTSISLYCGNISSPPILTICSALSQASTDCGLRTWRGLSCLIQNGKQIKIYLNTGCLTKLFPLWQLWIQLSQLFLYWFSKFLYLYCYKLSAFETIHFMWYTL